MTRDAPQLPCDCEAPYEDPRALYARVLDIALANGWTLHQAAEYAARLRANVIDLAAERRRRNDA